MSISFIGLPLRTLVQYLNPLSVRTRHVYDEKRSSGPIILLETVVTDSLQLLKNLTISIGLTSAKSQQITKTTTDSGAVISSANLP